MKKAIVFFVFLSSLPIFLCTTVDAKKDRRDYFPVEWTVNKSDGTQAGGKVYVWRQKALDRCNFAADSLYYRLYHQKVKEVLNERYPGATGVHLGYCKHKPMKRYEISEQEPDAIFIDVPVSERKEK